MADFKVSQRYAVSLLETAIEKKSLDKTAEDMSLIIKAIETSKQLQRMLESPVIRPELKNKILNEIFKNKISDESLKFIDFIVDKKRENLLGSIASRFLELRDAYLGIADVKVTSAFEFSEDQKKLFGQKLEKVLNKKVRLNFSTDENIIGGFVAKSGDTLYDASVKHQLEQLRKQLLSGGISLN